MQRAKSIYYPFLATQNLDGRKQPPEEAERVRVGLMALTKEQRDRLMSQNFAEAMAVLDEQYHLPEQYIEYVTVLIREMFFGHSSEFEVLRVLRTELAKIPGISLDAVIQHIQLNVFRAQPDPEEPDEEVVAAAPVAIDGETKEVLLLDALAKYPRLGDQIITTEKIKLRQSAEPVRPTITNWLKVYRDDLGIGKHDAASRAQFLFEGINTKGLPSAERDHIHALIRSLEDDEALLLDVRQQVILFAAPASVVARATQVAQEAPAVGARPVFTSATSVTPATSSVVPSVPPGTTEPEVKDLFERFSESRRAPEAPAMRNVGTASFGSVHTPVTKTLAQEKAILEKIKTAPSTAPVAPSPFTTSESQDRNTSAGGTLRFSAKQVLPSERHEAAVVTSLPHNLTSAPVTAPAPTSQPVQQVTLQKSAQSIATLQQVQRVVTPATQPLPVTKNIPSAPPARPVVTPQQNMFRIKPTQE